MNLGNVMIFGDSYSTYKGYIPEGYAVYYSGNRGVLPDVYSVDNTWWGRLLKKTDSKLLLNNSWSGSTLGHTGYNGADCSTGSSFIARFEKLLGEGFFEKNEVNTLFVFGGTNDSWSDAPLGELKLGDENENAFFVLPAIHYFARRLKESLIDTRIIFIANCDIKEEVIDGMKKVSDYYDLTFVKLENIDKLSRHPTELGMEQICEQVLKSL